MVDSVGVSVPMTLSMPQNDSTSLAQVDVRRQSEDASERTGDSEQDEKQSFTADNCSNAPTGFPPRRLNPKDVFDGT